jgi:N utilization substance protein A
MALLSNGKRCPNAALPGTKYCGVPAHQALASGDPGAGPVAVEAELTPEELAAEEAAVAEAERSEELSPSAGAMLDGAAGELVVEELEDEVVSEAEEVVARAAAEPGAGDAPSGGEDEDRA